MPTPQVQ
jgi:hypothetical protein